MAEKTHKNESLIKLLVVLLVILIGALLYQSWMMYDLRKTVARLSLPVAATTPGPVTSSHQLPKPLMHQGIKNRPLPPSHPFVAMQQMQQQMDRWFDDSMKQFFNKNQRSPFFSANLNSRVSVVDGKDDFQVILHVPNLNKENITVDINGHQLTLSGRVDFNNKKNRGMQEMVSSQFTRSFTLPQDVDPQSMQSKYHDGKLMLMFKKGKN